MKRLFVVIGLFSCFTVGAVQAEDERRMEEVIVTATKREADVQDIPIAVSAFAGDELAKRGVIEFDGLMEVSPSIAIQQSSNSGQGGSIRIRGVGTAGSNPGLEAAVGTFIDGIYRSRAGQAFSDLGDVARIEILRGPQGTLFGKNTVAGAVSVVTNKPQFEKNAQLSVGMGNYDSRVSKGFVNTHIDDEWAFRMSFGWNERDGFEEDTNTSDAYNDRNRYSIKAQVLWVPTDKVEARLIVDYTDKDEACCVASFTQIGAVTGLLAVPLGGNTDLFENDSDPQVGLNFPPFTDIQDQGISLDVSWDISDNVSFRSLTGYREYDMRRGVDPDVSSADILSTLDTTNTFENFSQEFHLIGSTGKLDWFVGTYFYTEDMFSDEIVVFSTDGPAYLSALLALSGLDVPAAIYEGNPSNRQEVPGHVLNQGFDSDFNSKTDGWSVFTNNTWHATDRLEFTLGVRFSHEEKQGQGIINGAAVGAAPVNDPFCGIVPVPSTFCNNPSFKDDITEEEYTGTIKAAYQFGDDINTYFGLSRGYKAGGFNLDQEALKVDGVTFDPEFSTSWELGVKSTLLDGSLRLNTALFYTEFRDFQLNAFDGFGFFITNVKGAVSQGLELESVYAVSDSVSLTFGVTYADARYVDKGEILADATSDVAGKRLNLSPLWQSSAALFVEDNLPGTDWTYAANVNWSHVGEVNTGSNLAPEKVRGAYNKWNALLGVTSPSGRYTANLWGRNLGNTSRNNIVFATPLQSGSFSTFLTIGRTYGVTFSAYLD
ncbi:MAG: TonB-dependent receptor [Pseudomonadales bacterium]|nr:TonB-dependent receptor [Pseudomonadales bacterium]